jgi:dephospho-CoA kinase
VLRVGLTGGVACGKSTVGRMLADRGARFLQADALAHQLYVPGQPTYRAIVDHFGRDIVNLDHTINRQRLADIVFPDRIKELNAIVHPAVIEAQNKWLQDMERTDPQAIAIVEAALIIEAGAAKDFDKLIVVTCDRDKKIARYAKRANISVEEAAAEVLRRSAAQLSDDDKASHADFLIDNSGPLEDTASYVDALWMRLTEFTPQPTDRSAPRTPRVQ